MMLKYYNYDWANKYSIEQMENGIEIDTNIEDFFKINAKSTAVNYKTMDDFLKTYDVDIEINNNGREQFKLIGGKDNRQMSDIEREYHRMDIYGGYGYDLYDCGTGMLYDDILPHYVTFTGKYADDGKPIVSSWGQKFTIQLRGEQAKHLWNAGGSKTSIATISGSNGGYICNNCLTNETIVDEKTIKLIRMFCYVDISKISKLEISDKVKLEINTFLEDYYDKYTGLYLKTKDFLKNLNRI